MSAKICGLLLLIILATYVLEGNCVRLKLTKIQCNITKPEVITLDVCKVKAESRYVQYIKLYATLKKPPLRSYKIRVQIMKRANGWHPFLYDITSDCETAKHLNKLSRFVSPHVTNLSNIRSIKCPINLSYFEATRIENRYVESVLQVLPVPKGDYGVFVTLTLNDQEVGMINTYANIF